MTLPPSLQAWHPWLTWFAPELAAAVGDVLRRMHPLLGRFQGRRQGGVAEPDGVEDLRRRGSYERLLSSEWLLATELPDEFLRRAAGGEHLFLAPRPRAMHADKLIVAIFDTGPWQLGAPRLAHLALWILLARRAQEAGGALRWGALHQPGQWHDANTPEQLKHMLRTRSFDVAGDAQWTQWTQWLEANAIGVGETWLIGHAVDGARAQARPPSHTVQIRAGLNGDTLEVALRTGSAARAMQVPLPPAQPAARLLRGQFFAEASARAHEQRADRLSLKFAPIIAPNGLLVTVPLLDEAGVMIFRIPPQGERKRGKHKQQHWGKGAELLCAAFCGKSFTAVLSQKGQLYFWQNQALGTQPRPLKQAFDAPPGRGSLLPCIWQRDASHSRLFVQDSAGRLVFWVGVHQHKSVRDARRGPMILDHGLLAMAPVDDHRLVYVSREKEQLWVRFAGSNGREQITHQLSLSPDNQTKVLLTGGLRWNKGFGGCAVRTSAVDAPELWQVQHGSTAVDVPHERWQIELAPGAKAVGLVQIASSGDYALVVQASNRHDLALHTSTGAEPLLTLTSAIARISVCPNTGLTAMLTADRALHVYSLADKVLRLVVHSGATTPESDAIHG
jgi:hypothetical protein